MLSIIVPIYNAENYMRPCIDSILNQTYKDFELLLIDDGSKDLSGGICDEYVKKDGRVRVFHKENGGCSSARNLGLKKAKGEYIAFVDADDVLDMDMYEILIRNLHDTDSDVSACTFIREYNPQRIVSKMNDSLPPVLVFSGKEMYVSMTRESQSIEGLVWNKVWKREIVIDQTFRTDVAIVDDAIYSWDAFKKVKKVCFINLPLYHYLIIPTSITRNSSMDKYLKALHGYEIMIDEASQIDDSVRDCLIIEYLSWNVTALSQLANQDQLDFQLYKLFIDNVKKYKDYYKKAEFKVSISLRIAEVNPAIGIKFFRIRNKMKYIKSRAKARQ